MDTEVWSLQEILSNVDFEVPTGARAVIVGPNGCGKTTLLTTIADRDTVEGHSAIPSRQVLDDFEGWPKMHQLILLNLY